MKTEPTTLDAEVLPKWELKLYQDRNGNWFGSVLGNLPITFCYTPTYTTPKEAIDEAYRRLPPEGK